MHPSRRGRRLGGGGLVVDGSTCSLVWERRTTCWVTMRVPDPNILVVRRPLPVREGWDLDHHVTACSEGARACWGGGGAGPAFGPAPFLLGGGRGSKRSAPLFPGPQGEPAHGLHPRFVVAEIWADWDGGGGGGADGPVVFSAHYSSHVRFESSRISQCLTCSGRLKEVPF